MDQAAIRNFCIIAHIDHGKSTLADRLLEVTGTVEQRSMRNQLLDTMDLERERGITIKLQPVTMRYKEYTLNLIDTPGHVDFTYEVSRSLAAVEGALLLVDATQGIQAQTLTTLHQARQANLKLIPVINKIDLPNAEPERVAQEVMTLLDCSDDDILFASGKTGEGVPEILEAVIDRIPAPAGATDRPLRALIFDSFYDSYRGVVSYIRIQDGALPSRAPITFCATTGSDEALEVGILQPKMNKGEALATGMIGYVVTGVKDVSQARVGDTITLTHQPTNEPLAGYQRVIPMVYAGLYSADGRPEELRVALEKLKLNDAALEFEPDHSQAFGFGFRCGFLGLLHLDIVRERLEREYNLELIISTPSVAYHERQEGGKTVYAEPWVKAEIVTPQAQLGAVMELAQSRRGRYVETRYLGQTTNAEPSRVVLVYELPLATVIVNFHDALKSVSSGYASLSYEPLEYREGNLVRLDILIAGEVVGELHQIVDRSEAFGRGVTTASKLKELIPKQQFEVAIQAAIGGKIIARETVPALRKDVTAKLYGGDRTRKDKLLKKQKEGKKRLRKLGKVDIPSDVFMKLLS